MFDNGPIGVRHEGVSCRHCRELHIFGIRWKCAQCDNYDLCSKCYMSDKHDVDHQFRRFDSKESRGVQTVGPRKMAK